MRKAKNNSGDMVLTEGADGSTIELDLDIEVILALLAGDVVYMPILVCGAFDGYSRDVKLRFVAGKDGEKIVSE